MTLYDKLSSLGNESLPEDIIEPTKCLNGDDVIQVLYNSLKHFYTYGTSDNTRAVLLNCSQGAYLFPFYFSYEDTCNIYFINLHPHPEHQYYIKRYRRSSLSDINPPYPLKLKSSICEDTLTIPYPNDLIDYDTNEEDYEEEYKSSMLLMLESQNGFRR